MKSILCAIINKIQLSIQLQVEFTNCILKKKIVIYKYCLFIINSVGAVIVISNYKVKNVEIYIL